MESVNPFEALADKQLTAAAKRQHQAAERRAAKSVVLSEADAPMKPNAMEAARDERNAQVAGYIRYKARQRDDLLNGSHGREVARLVALLKSMTIDNAGILVQGVFGMTWMYEVDLNTRHAILSMIDDAIVKLRIRSGLAPFDDAIGDEPPTAFQLIRRKLIGV